MRRDKYEIQGPDINNQRYPNLKLARSQMAVLHRAKKAYKLFRLYAPDGKLAPPIRVLIEAWYPA